jgi:protein-arginine kinase activator protein McsA
VTASSLIADQLVRGIFQIARADVKRVVASSPGTGRAKNREATMECTNCNASFSFPIIHITEIRNGVKSERHLCQDCAEKEGGLPIPKRSESTPVQKTEPYANLIKVLMEKQKKPRRRRKS